MSCKCDLNDKLEAERLDVTFRAPASETIGPCARPHFECKKPHNPVCQRPHFTDKTNEAFANLYFNAGRYAAGARDSVAVKANNLYWEQFTR